MRAAVNLQDQRRRSLAGPGSRRSRNEPPLNLQAIMAARPAQGLHIRERTQRQQVRIEIGDAFGVAALHHADIRRSVVVSRV